MFKLSQIGYGTTSNPRIQDQVKSFRALGLIYYYATFPCLFLLLCLSSCGSKQTTFVQPTKETIQILTEEERARLHDISFPSEVVLEKIMVPVGQIALSYSTKLAMHDVFDFYRTDMEYLGWDLVTSFRAEESCLIFEKPTRRSIINLRANTSHAGTRVVMFIGSKK